MKYHAFYVNNDLLIRIKNKECTSYKKEGNISILYNGEEVIGYNILDFPVKLESGLVKLTDEINNEVNKQLQIINHDELEIDDNNYFVIGYIKEIEKHPESKKLNICQVDIGESVNQIVCGASNVDAGQKVVVAKVGAVLFDGTWIKKGNLMKAESNGMICSSKELALTKESNGILVLDDTYNVGEPFIGLK